MGTFDWSTQNTKLAATLGYLQFPIRLDKTLDERSGKELTQYFIGPQSVTEPVVNRDELLERHKDGALEREEPLHAFLQGQRVQHNYERLIEAQKTGCKLRLQEVAGGFATEYRHGQEAVGSVDAQHVFRLADLSLVAALGTLGVPCLNIEYNGEFHIYTLPIEGMLLRMPDGTRARYCALNLAMRQEGDTRNLLLEASDPKHPLVHAYGVRHVHAQLRKAMKAEKGRVLLRPEGTKRMAFISPDAPGHTLDRVFAHFKV